MKTETAQEIILGIDYPLLKEQKKSLLKLLEDIDNVPLLEHLEGIVTLINSIQDCAVDTYGKDENEVFDLHEDDTEEETVIPESYFKIVHSGYQKDLGREEIQVHGGKNANIFLIKTDEGFVIDVYGQNDLIDTLAIFEDVLSADAGDDDDKCTNGLHLGTPKVVQEFVNNFKDTLNKNIYSIPEEETGAPENFSDVEVAEFKQKWGQTHKDLCEELGYDLKTSDDVIMLDYFWYAPVKGKGMWIPKSASLYSPREEKIADFLRLG